MTGQLLDAVDEAADGEPIETVVARAPESDDGTAVVAMVPDSIETGLTKDELFELLKNQRRRDAVEFLKEQGGWTTLSEMAEHIAAKENGIDVNLLNSKQRKRVYIGLYQCHLPKMATAGVVDYDKSRGTIGLTELAAELDPFLDGGAMGAKQSGSGSPASLRRTLLAGGAVGLVALAGGMGAPGLGAVPAVAWTVVSSLTLVGLAALSLRS